MAGRFVEIEQKDRHLSLYRGFLQIRDKGKLLGQVPLDDILALVVTAHGCTHSSNILEALAKRNIPFTICGTNYSPVAYLLPLAGHHQQSARMIAQAKAPKPLCKRLWQKIVQTKIRHQAAVLDLCSSGGEALRQMALRVRSGDTSNMEAQTARRYWTKLFGADFHRAPGGSSPNALLNYAYAIIRSCVARGVIAAGLHPTLGIHHYGPANPMCLVDDLMEPFRPLADCAVWHLAQRNITEVTKQAKQALAALAILDLPGAQGITPVFQSSSRLATSLAQVFMGERKDLELPGFPEPLVLCRLGASD